MISYFDTHCHLDMDRYGDELDLILHRSHKNNVHHIISIGIDLQSSQKAIKLAKKHEGIFASVGVHPHDVDSINDNTYEQLSSLITDNPEEVVGYGEIGLDYFKNYSDPKTQQIHFRKQLELAKHHTLPIIIHDRDAHQDIINTLNDMCPFEAGGILHCFSGDYNFAKQILELGFYISIPGIVTFKNAHELQEVAKKIPLDRMLLETDGPFLAPHPHRGKRNEPSYIPLIAQKIADLRKINIEAIAQATTSNAATLFNLSL